MHDILRKKDGAWFWNDDRMNVKASEALTMLSDVFATAGGVAYYRGDQIANSDVASFRVLNEWLAKDNGHVYYCDTHRKDTEYWLVKRGRIRVVAGADPATFHVLGSRYSRDAARIYWEGEPIPIRDPATFAALESSYARDRVTGYYLRVRVEGSDGATFAAVSDYYAKDAAHVFYDGKAIQDADAASCAWLGAESTPTADAKDVRGLFQHGVRLHP